MNSKNITRALWKEMLREEKNFEDANCVPYLDEVENGLMYIVQLVLDNLASVLKHVLKNITNNNIIIYYNCRN